MAMVTAAGDARLRRKRDAGVGVIGLERGRAQIDLLLRRAGIGDRSVPGVQMQAQNVVLPFSVKADRLVATWKYVTP